MHLPFPNLAPALGYNNLMQGNSPMAPSHRPAASPSQSPHPTPMPCTFWMDQIQLPDDRSCMAHGTEGDGSAPSFQLCPDAHPLAVNWLKRVFRPRAPRQELFPDGCETD